MGPVVMDAIGVATGAIGMIPGTTSIGWATPARSPRKHINALKNDARNHKILSVKDVNEIMWSLTLLQS